MSKFVEVQSLNRTAGWLQALLTGIEQAGGNPRLDPPRIASQKGLAEQIGQLIVGRMFVKKGSFPLSLRHVNSTRRLLEMFGWELDQTSYGGEAFAKRYWAEIDQVSQTLQNRSFNCEILVPVRETSYKELRGLLDRLNPKPTLATAHFVLAACCGQAKTVPEPNNWVHCLADVPDRVIAGFNARSKIYHLAPVGGCHLKAGAQVMVMYDCS